LTCEFGFSFEVLFKNNESTSIGTLEFMDRITKFNLIDINCDIDIDDKGLSNIYENIKSGGRIKKYKTRRFISKKNKKRTYKKYE
jgi:hypothetical protein